jgi:hypothetical protein
MHFISRLVFIEENAQILPVATHLPDGYLSIQPLGLGKGVSNINISYLRSNFILLPIIL